MLNMHSKIALVTGGASGIGRACARHLAARGVSVVIADRALSEAEALAATIGGHSLAVQADVSDEASCQAMAALVIERFGRLDIAVNSAGVGNPDRSLVADLASTGWRRILGTNLDGIFFSLKAEINAMLQNDGGVIVNVASVMGLVGIAGASAYVAAKHGVVGLTKAAALDYADRNIRVNAVAPGYVDTAMMAGRTSKERFEIATRHPLGRLARDEEIASIICFLASDEASFVTGTCYPIDGGYTAR